ncbi:MAG: DUF4105 domain-containing protein [Treponema sp.]|jgi:hypothetical protein|nr:DUF4105 domain-containing protein [Treponema sp.]
MVFKKTNPLGVLLILVLLLLPGIGLFALTAPETLDTGDDRFSLKIAVIGPGDELYFWWGHIALIVEDRITGRSLFYDYGIFSFDNENFFLNFAMGRLLYSCGVSPAELNYQNYIRTNRDITVYTLDLSPEVKEEVRRFAENNVLPENRDYFYHHFKDNCATRIRDILDLATGGQFKERFGQAPGRYTLRQHVRRHTWFSPFFDWLLNFLMGQDIDLPITVWEEMFLPGEIGARIQDFRYIDPSGRERPLVSAGETLSRAVNRPPVLEIPRRQWPRELLLGFFITVVFAGLILWGKGKPGFPRVCLGLGQSFLGFFFGLAGTVLFFMTLFTDHDYTYHNSNILYINPLLLAALPLGIIFAFTGDKKKQLSAARFLRVLWTYVFFGGILTMAIKLLPGFYQQNQVTQALVLPIALVLSSIPSRGRKLLKALKHSG